jgi:subtilisin-like proprotein convertase family protein
MRGFVRPKAGKAPQLFNQKKFAVEKTLNLTRKLLDKGCSHSSDNLDEPTTLHWRQNAGWQFPSAAMKPAILKTAAMLLLLAAGLIPARAQYSTNNFSFSVLATVPDGNASGLANNQTLGGMGDTITSVSVTLNISNAPGDTAFNGDLYAYLRLGGISSILLNRTGVGGANSDGYADTGFNVTFTTAATDNIHFYQGGTYNLNAAGQLTGTWQPDGRTNDPQSSLAIFDSTSPTALLDAFNGKDPNGKWTLFLADLADGGKSQLVGWGLQIVTVPEPPAWALLAMGALWMFRQLRIGNRRRAC